MGCVIAMAGKGGTGKTTVAAFLVRIIKEKKLGSILAVDADPNSNFGEVLGLEVKETIGDILDDICVHPERVPSNMGKDAFIDYRVQTAIIEADGFDLLTMGRPEGPGCYCYVNNSLCNAMDKLIKEYDFVLIDNEAGLEHLSRRTTRRVDTLLVISDPSVVGLRAAKRIADLARELNIRTKKEFLIVNRASGDIAFDKLQELRLVYLGSLAVDTEIEELNKLGASLAGLTGNNKTIATLRRLGEKIWLCN